MNFILSMMITVLVYLLVPTIISIAHARLSLKQIKIITIVNAIVGFIGFSIVQYLLDSTPNVFACVLWSSVAYYMVKRFCYVIDTDTTPSITASQLPTEISPTAINLLDIKDELAASMIIGGSETPPDTCDFYQYVPIDNFLSNHKYEEFHPVDMELVCDELAALCPDEYKSFIHELPKIPIKNEKDFETDKKAKEDVKRIIKRIDYADKSLSAPEFFVINIICKLATVENSTTTKIINSNLFSLCDVAIFLYYITNLNVELTSSSFKPKSPADKFSLDYYSKLCDALSKYLDINKTEIDIMANNRIEYYDSLTKPINETENKFEKIAVVFKYILFMDLVEKRFVPYTADTPLYLLEIMDLINCEAEIASLVASIPSIYDEFQSIFCSD